MAKISSSLIIAIIVVCLAVRCRYAMIDWPNQVHNSTDPAGFLTRFQISSNHPNDNQTFTAQATFVLKRDIDWQGLSDLNEFYIYGIADLQNKSLDLKDKRQFTNQSGKYKAGDNITLGFNYTFNILQNATQGRIYVRLGNQDRKNFQFIYVLFKMPKITQNSNSNKPHIKEVYGNIQQSIHYTYKQLQELPQYKNGLTSVKKSYQFANLRNEQIENIRRKQVSQ